MATLLMLRLLPPVPLWQLLPARQLLVVALRLLLPILAEATAGTAAVEGPETAALPVAPAEGRRAHPTADRRDAAAAR